MKPATSLFPAATAALCAAALTLGCDDAAPSLEIAEVTVIEAPAAPGSSLPHVAADPQGPILSWVEAVSGGDHVLRFARWTGAGWTEPLEVAAGSDWFVNWADFPSVVPLGDGELAAHWLQRSGAGTYEYDVMIARSRDGGRTWSDPIRPHSDGTATEHGFVSLFPSGDRLGVVWLDGRKYADAEHGAATNEMTLRFAMLGDSIGAEMMLDGRACDCCQTAVALTSAGPLVAYRDRSAEEIRDIAVTRLVDGRWTEPVPVHDDGWRINACPVNGPQADARGADVAVAWFTAAADTPRVLVAFSHDAGATFGAPVRVDGGDPLGRVDLVMAEDGRVLVVWLERSAEGADVRGRLVTPEGQAGVPATLGSTAAGRPSGFPRMALYEGGVLLAWTVPGEPSAIRTAVVRMD